MSTALFDTSTVPHWRVAGQVTVPEPVRLRLGDPCHGLEDIGVPVPAGTWVWEIRDADEHGVSAHRVWEVRLRRGDQGPAEDWAWDDDYGDWAEQPAPGARMVGSRGVDAGIIAWELIGAGYRRHGDDGDLLDQEKLDGVPTRGGQLFGTTTGWGDGGYPVAARIGADGELLEARTCYITPDPAPLTAAQFTELFPGAFTDLADVLGLAGPFTLHLSRVSYTSMDGVDETALVVNGYDILHSVSATDAHGPVRLTSRYTDLDERLHAQASISRVSGLWSRVPNAERHLLVAREVAEDAVDEPERVRGRIMAHSTAEVAITLTL